MKIKNALLILFILSSALSGCRKERMIDTSPKTVTYTFVPNGVNAHIGYQSVQMRKLVDVGSKNTLFSVDDEVIIGSKTTLVMTTPSAIAPAGYEIRISYNGNQIASASGFKDLTLKKTFTKEDFN
jgi:hypothetical protein